MKNSNSFLVFILSSFLWMNSCTRNTPTTSALNLIQMGNLSQALISIHKWQQTDSNAVAPKFLSALVNFMTGSNDSLEIARSDAFATNEKKKKLIEWALTELTKSPETATKYFLLGLIDQMEDKHQEATQHFKLAESMGNIPAVFMQHIETTKEAIASLKIFVPEDSPIRYEGTMRNNKGIWIPATEDFKVTSGKLISIMGKKKYTAEFKGVSILHSDKDSLLIWAPILVKGQILIQVAIDSNRGKETPVIPTVETKFKRIPLDFWGKVVIIELDSLKGHSIPIIIMPNKNNGSNCSAVAIIGNHVPAALAYFKEPNVGSGSIGFLSPGASSPKHGIPTNYKKSDDPEKCFCWQEKGSIYNTTSGLAGFEFTNTGVSYFGKGIRLLVEEGKWWGKVEIEAYLK